MLYMFQVVSLPVIRSSKTVHASGGRKQACHRPDAACTVFELLMMGRKTARNMYNTDDNKRILYNIASCWLYLKEYINDARSHKRQKYCTIPATDRPTLLVITDSTSPVPRTSLVCTFGKYY